MNKDNVKIYTKERRIQVKDDTFALLIIQRDEVWGSQNTPFNSHP